MVEQRVEVVENVFPRDGIVGILYSELRDCGVFQVGEREALARSSPRRVTRDAVRHLG